MNPHDLSARVELAYGGGISGFALLTHYLNDYVTPWATGIGAICGAIVGTHALYRLFRPKTGRYGDRRHKDD